MRSSVCETSAKLVSRWRPGVTGSVWTRLRAGLGSAKAVAAVAALLAVSSIAAAVYVGRTPLVTATATAIQFLVFPPEGGSFNRAPARTFFALSPDGSQLAFVAGTD